MTDKVFVAMPYSGRVEFGATQMLWCPSRTPGRVDKVCGVDSSSLPTSFNDGLCMALNRRDDGLCGQFAMIHSDVVPEPNWLDKLCALRLEHGLDVLSVVIAIKLHTDDPDMSTGIADASDRWNVKRCLTRKEAAALPPVFTGKDVCGPGEILVVNTGLWVADLCHPHWDDFPGFEQRHRIGRGNDGRWRGWQRTEDWELSYHLHEHGVRYGATTAVRVNHHGNGIWPNT